jgi:hypothetical protein
VPLAFLRLFVIQTLPALRVPYPSAPLPAGSRYDILLAQEHHPKLAGVLPRIYATSNLEPDQVTGLINLFYKDVFGQKNGADLLGRTYECCLRMNSQANTGGKPSSGYRIN